MPLPSYLQDEDEDEDQLPFLRDRRDLNDEDEAFATGDPASLDDGGDMPELAPPPRSKPPGSQVTPEMRAILRPNAAPGVSPQTQAANDARAELATAKGAVPMPAQPKWWQRLAAGAVGAAAGYSNASGRRHPEIDATPAVEGIMGAGKYGRDMLKYRQGVTAAQAKADAAGATEASWWKNRQLNNQEQLQAAQAQAATDHASYWRHRAESEQNEWKLDGKTGDMYNTVTGERHPKAASISEHIKDLVAAGYTQDEAKIVASGGHLTAEKPVPEPKPRSLVNVPPGHSVYDPEKGKTVYTAPGKPEGGPKPPTRGQMTMIERRKNDALRRAEAETRRLVATGQDETAAFADLERQKQEIQNSYENEIATAIDDDPGHFEYPARPAPQPKPAAGGGRGAPPKPAAGDRGAPAAVSSPPKDVLDKLTPGEHTFRNGQTWRKYPDGRAVLVAPK